MSTNNDYLQGKPPQSNRIMKVLIQVFRIIVGSLFIVSGLVKANDPLGFSYKLEEYFVHDALNIEFLEPLALGLGILACLAEVVLGVAVLIGGRMKLTTWSLLLLTVFFGWLTLYTAMCDPHEKWIDTYSTTVSEEQGASLSAKLYDEKYDQVDSLVNTGVAYDDTLGLFQKLFAGPHETVSVNEGDYELTGLVVGNFVITDIQGAELEVEEIRSPVCVTDCGCFGDALKGSIGRSLTPWESFTKDAILFVLLIPIFMRRKEIKLYEGKEAWIMIGGGIVMTVILGGWLFGWWFPVIFTAICFGITEVLRRVLSEKPWKEWAIAGAVTLATVVFIWWNYNHLPAKDYRPYRIGNNLPELMKTCSELEGVECPVYVTMYRIEDTQTGEIFEISSADWMQREELWDTGVYPILDSWGPIKIKDGYESPISDLQMYDASGVDIAPDIFANPGKVFILLSRDLEALGEFDEEDINGQETLFFTPTNDAKAWFEEINALASECQAKGIPFIGWTPASEDRINVFRHEMQTAFDFTTGDEITIKTVVRSNPGLLLIEGGVVKGKWHANDLPDFSEIEANF